MLIIYIKLDLSALRFLANGMQCYAMVYTLCNVWTGKWHAMHVNVQSVIAQRVGNHIQFPLM